MGECFKLTRRKFGVVTLVMACVVMLAWVDSFNGDLTFGIEHSGGMDSGNTSIGIYQHSLELRETRSTHRRVSLAQATAAGDVKIIAIFEELNHSSDPESPGPLERPEPGQAVVSIDRDSTRRKRIETMNIEIFRKAKKVFSIPLWSICIPLTLLSAFLLLFKPGESTLKKITVPVPLAGA